MSIAGPACRTRDHATRSSCGKLRVSRCCAQNRQPAARPQEAAVEAALAVDRADAETADRIRRTEDVDDVSRVDPIAPAAGTWQLPALMPAGLDTGTVPDIADGVAVDAIRNGRADAASDRPLPNCTTWRWSAPGGGPRFSGRLSQLENEMGCVGLRIHRLHRVSLSHVRRVFRSQRGWLCELRDGRRLPIARRRVPDVQDRLPHDFVMNHAVE